MKGKLTAKDVRGSSTRGGLYWKEYKTWQRIISKCNNPNHHRYANYGAKGITIDDIYKYSFLNFINEVGVCPSPKEEYSIERIDNNMSYVAGNMAWIKHAMQALNKSSNRVVEYLGQKLPLSVLCKDLNCNYDTASTRLGRGFSIEEAVKQERTYVSRKVTYKGKKVALTSLVRNLKLNLDRCLKLYNQGYGGDEIVANPLSRLVRKHKTYMYNGLDMTATGWAKYLKVSRTTVDTKLRKGYSIGFICDTYLNRDPDA
jgi:hypothetical protein